MKILIILTSLSDYFDCHIVRKVCESTSISFYSNHMTVFTHSISINTWTLFTWNNSPKIVVIRSNEFSNIYLNQGVGLLNLWSDPLYVGIAVSMEANIIEKWNLKLDIHCIFKITNYFIGPMILLKKQILEGILVFDTKIMSRTYHIKAFLNLFFLDMIMKVLAQNSFTLMWRLYPLIKKKLQTKKEKGKNFGKFVASNQSHVYFRCFVATFLFFLKPESKKWKKLLNWRSYFCWGELAFDQNQYFNFSKIFLKEREI